MGLYVCMDSFTWHSQKWGQTEKSGGLLVGGGAVGDTLLNERQAVHSQAHWREYCLKKEEEKRQSVTLVW